jgi:multicomponent Na+:H+ antiporter subunit A
MLALLILILLCFGLAPCVPLLGRQVGQRLGLLLATFAALIFSYLLFSLAEIVSGSSFQQTWEWVPSLQVNLGLRIDGLSLLFGLIISGIGSLVFVYASHYLNGDKNLNKLYLYLLLFMGSMLGVVFSDNLLLLFVFWELTSFTSYFLIGFNHHDPAARSAALQALLVTAGGGLVLLLGILMLGLGGWQL